MCPRWPATGHTPGFQQITPASWAEPPQALAAPITPAQNLQRKMRVASVEDDKQSPMLFDEMRQTRSDIELYTAKNVSQGFELASHWQLDGSLPGTHGALLLQRMRGIPGLQTTPAYMCSADALPEHIQRAEQAGFIGDWTKPVDFGKVFDAFDRLAARPDSRRVPFGLRSCAGSD